MYINIQIITCTAEAASHGGVGLVVVGGSGGVGARLLQTISATQHQVFLPRSGSQTTLKNGKDITTALTRSCRAVISLATV